MLLKCFVVILIIFLKIILLCDADEDVKGKKDIDSNKNSTLPFNTHTKRFKKHYYKLRLNATAETYLQNATANRLKLKGVKGIYLNEYYVLTCCGHVLSTFRLTSEENNVQPDNCPVLLVHGLFQSSDTFLEHDKEQSLAMKLQELGYDVWLANMRGNKYNREHMVLAPETNKVDRNEYFNYTYEELGTRDIAETVDFVLRITSHEKLIYIGHSLGGTAFLVLNSLKPEYNSKFAIAYLFAPLGYQKNFPDDVLKTETEKLDEIYKSLLNEGLTEIFPYTSDDKATFLPEDCLGNKSYSNICEQLNIQRIMGLKSVNNDVAETRGGSIGPLFHLAQNVRSGNFSRWDYGEQENLKQYKTSTPPTYDLSLVTVRTRIIYASNDEFVSPVDISLMASKMIGGDVKIRPVKRISFKHEDFIIGSDAMENVYAGIIDELVKNKSMCRDEHQGLWFYIEEYKTIWISVLIIIVLTIIAVCLLDCNRRIHKKNRCKVQSH